MPILSSWLSHLYLQHITVRIDGWMDGLIILVFYRSFLIPFLLNLGQDDYNKEKRFTQCTKQSVSLAGGNNTTLGETLFLCINKLPLLNWCHHRCTLSWKNVHSIVLLWSSLFNDRKRNIGIFKRCPPAPPNCIESNWKWHTCIQVSLSKGKKKWLKTYFYLGIFLYPTQCFEICKIWEVRWLSTQNIPNFQ